MREAAEMTLWFAGKEMRCGNALKDHIGSKENTTAVIRLVPVDHGAPSREPVFSLFSHSMPHLCDLGDRRSNV